MRKKAVLIGINYPGTDNELHGCVNDVQQIYAALVEQFGFAEEDIVMLIDTDDSFVQPTGGNIRLAIQKLVAFAKPGDQLFLHYSGHGTRLPAETGEEDDTGFDECIVPSDYNLITDEDFKKFVEEVPEGCQITIVSDSCHSGGLLQGSKEQIGNSSIKHRQKEGFDSGTGDMEEGVTDALDHEEEEEQQEEEEEEQQEEEENREYHRHGRIRKRSLPLPDLIEILKQKSGKEDIDVGKIRPTLFHMFGEEASGKVKNFMDFILDKVSRHSSSVHQGGLVEGSLAREFMQNKVVKPHEVYAGKRYHDLPDNGILISGCQTDEFSIDACADDGQSFYGALTNAILTVLKQSDGVISNKELVVQVRSLLQEQGLSQHPGLYCTNDNLDAPFIS